MKDQFKQRIVAELKNRRANFKSDKSLAIHLGINESQLSRIMKGDWDKVLADEKWISIARQLELNLKGQADWKTANTPVFNTIMSLLKKCQQDGISGILCDSADIGKTYSARVYARSNKGAIYIDCSQVKSKQRLIREIAKQFGVTHTGRYTDVYEDLVNYIANLDSPLIILDEAGDLQYDAMLELKALWNATERSCGYFMMGADGLKEKMRRAIENKKVGFTELFSRFGKRFQRITPEGREENERFAKAQASQIIKVNAPANVDVQKMLGKTDGSLRRIYTEISKG